MIPIYEQGGGKGIGYGINGFIDRFDQIWKQHVDSSRAQSFAFIFYDFTDASIRSVLKDQGVFAQLDRLAGKQLGIFYLHNGTRRSIEKFNQQFIAALDIAELVEMPCVVFFKFEEGLIGGVQIAQLDSADLINGFHELHAVIQRYLDEVVQGPPKNRSLKWIGSGAKFFGVELFRAALRRGLDAF